MSVDSDVDSRQFSNPGSVESGGYWSSGQYFSPPVQATSYELKLNDDVLGDWLGVSCSNRTFGNIYEFIDSVSPDVPCRDDGTDRSATPTRSDGGNSTTSGELGSPSEQTTSRSFLMETLWKLFDVPYGVPINFCDRVSLSPFKQGDTAVYYTPLLSGFHFQTMPKQPGEVSRTLCWFAPEKPEVRLPMFQQIQNIGKQPDFASVTGAFNTDFSISSWFAVLWQPIHIKNHTIQHTCGSFLCFYFINPPLLMNGSGFTGTECAFRTDRLGVNRAVWTLPLHTRPDVPLDSISTSASRTTTPVVTPQPVMPFPSDPRRTSRIRVPIFAIVPSRPRADVWFKSTGETGRRSATRAAPLFLLAAAAQLLRHEELTNPMWSDDFRLADVYHMTRHEPAIHDFISLNSA